MKVVVFKGHGSFREQSVAEHVWAMMEKICSEKNVSMPARSKFMACRHDPVFVEAVELSLCAGDDIVVVDLGLNYGRMRPVVMEYKIITGKGGCEHVVTPQDTDWVSTDMYPSKPSMVDLGCALNLTWSNTQKFEWYGHKAGFKVTHANGNVVSVAWLRDTYCERRHHAWSQYDNPTAPEGHDSKDAEVMIERADGERHYFPDSHEYRCGWQSPEQVKEWIKWAAENEAVPQPELPPWDDLENLVEAVKEKISDEYRASDEDDGVVHPGIQLSVGWDGKKDWGYQMGGEGYVPDQAKHPYQAAVRVQRDTDAERLASDIRGQLEEASA